MNSPITGKKMTLEEAIVSTTYLGIEISYLSKFYRCKFSDQGFTTTDLDEGNLKRLHQAYNKQKKGEGN